MLTLLSFLFKAANDIAYSDQYIKCYPIFKCLVLIYKTPNTHNRSCLFSLKINMQMGCRCQEALQSFVQIRSWHLTKQFLLVFIGVFCTNGFCQGYSL